MNTNWTRWRSVEAGKEQVKLNEAFNFDTLFRLWIRTKDIA